MANGHTRIWGGVLMSSQMCFIFIGVSDSKKLTQRTERNGTVHHSSIANPTEAL